MEKMVEKRNAGKKMEDMPKRLNRIVIRDLFKRFNYNIDLCNGESVAILSAPNGCGKTTIFNIVDFIFMPTLDKYKKICNYPFTECACILSNDRKVVLKVEEKPVFAKDNRRRFSGYSREIFSDSFRAGIYNKCFTIVIYDDSEENVLGTINITEMLMDIVDRPYRGMDYDDELAEIEDEGEIYEDINPRVRVSLRRNSLFCKKVRDELSQYGCNLTIEFIQADRLHNSITPGYIDTRVRYRDDYSDAKDPLTKACKELRDKYYIEAKEEFHARQSEASDSLPQNYLKAKAKKIPIDEFKQRWNTYIDDIRKFYDIGMLDSDETILSEADLDRAYENKCVFLNVYLDSFEKTLAPLRKEYDRMKLFTDILNKRNKGTLKEFKYGREGINITVAGEPLNINCLSSGEKHDFIMFYNLIFKAEKGSVVFVDEPEISLHINWQEEYIDRLLEICKINDLQAFVATHSPNIVNEHFDLMVERGVRDASK